MFILDTNVLSELMKPAPDRSVVDWISSSALAGLYITTIAQAEILYGIRLLPSGKRRAGIELTADEMFEEEFNGRILPFGSDAVRPYAEIAAARSRLGRPIAHADAQIAAIAFSNGASLVTRNVKDFEHCGITVLNPWTDK